MPTTINQGELWLTELDHARLAKLNGGHPPAVLRELLDCADLLPSPEIQPDIVTLRSQVRVREDETGEHSTLTLCYPHEAQPQAGLISVLSPIGMALLGRRAGARITWTLPNGQERAMTLESVLFQPEASGDYMT